MNGLQVQAYINALNLGLRKARALELALSLSRRKVA